MVEKNAYEAMAWSADPLVRDIYSEIDDRELDEIADSIMEVYFGSDYEYEDEDEPGWIDPMRQFEEPKKTKHLTHNEAADATVLASSIVDWANYGQAYGDYSDPPWEEYAAEENPPGPGARRIGSIGDVNPIDYGGGYIFSAPKVGGPWVEYYYGMDSEHPDVQDDPEEVPDLPAVVYRVDLYKNGREFLSWYDWVDWESIADSTGQDVKIYTTPSRLKSALARALAIQDAAGVIGWHEFDQYPLEITLGELVERWGE